MYIHTICTFVLYFPLQQGGMAMEGELANGLIVGHAYSVTDAKTVCI